MTDLLIACTCTDVHEINHVILKPIFEHDYSSVSDGKFKFFVDKLSK